MDTQGVSESGAGNGAPPGIFRGQVGEAEAKLRAAVKARIRARIAERVARGRQVEPAQVESGQLMATAADVVAYRATHGLSQRDLAARIGVSRGIVCECESGRRDGLTVRAWVSRELQAAGH